MPAAPEFSDALGDIGIVEVLQELEAYHAAKADGHVGISREVEVNLQRERRSTYPTADKGQIAAGGGIHVPELAYGVGYQYLLADTYHKALDAGGELIYAAGAEAELVGNILVADDGTRDELREQRDECAEADIVLLHVGVAAIDVYGVAHRLEGIERNGLWAELYQVSAGL